MWLAVLALTAVTVTTDLASNERRGLMACNIATNVNGIPYLSTNGIQVSTTAVNLSLGFFRLPPVGYMTVRIADAIPTGTTASLPVNLTLNGVSRPLTTMGGSELTAGDLTGTGVLLVFNDRFNGILQVVSTLV